MLKRSAVGVIDQAAWAISNVALIVGLARTLDPTTFGHFSLVYAALVLCSGLAVAASAEVLAVSRGRALRASTDTRAIARMGERAIGDLARFAAISPVATGSVFLLFLSRGAEINPVVWIIIAAPVNVLGEGLRTIGYSLGRVKISACMSLTWLSLQLLMVSAAWSFFELTWATVAGSWVLGGLAACVAGALLLGIRPAFRSLSAAEKTRRRSYMFEYVATAGPVQAMSFIAGAALGVQGAGVLRVLQTVFGPLNVLMAGLRNAVVPTAAQTLSGASLLKVGGLTAGGASAATCFAVAILMGFPQLGEWLIGGIWPSSVVVAGFGLGRVGVALVFGALVVLRAADASEASTRLRGITAVLVLFSFSLGSLWNLETAIWFSTVISLLVVPAWWHMALGAAHGHRK